jgi:hypothetical protein
MFILDQSNAFQAQSTQFDAREAEIVHDHQQLFCYFLEVADELCIVDHYKLNDEAVAPLRMVKTFLMDGRISYKFQLGEAENQFLRTLPFKDLACYFIQKDQLIAAFEEHVTFFEPIHLQCHLLEVDQKPFLYDLLERGNDWHIQAAAAPSLLRHIAPRLCPFPIHVKTPSHEWYIYDHVALASFQHCTNTFTLSSPHTATTIQCEQLSQCFTIRTTDKTAVQRAFSDCMLSYYEKV